MRNRRLYPTQGAVAALVLAIVLSPPCSKAGDNIEQHLRDQYNGKTLVLRNFYSGDKLAYDSAGQISGFASPGDWTIDGFLRTTSVKLSARRLTIQAERLPLANDGKAFQVLQINDKAKREYAKANSLRIEVELDSGADAGAGTEAVLSKIFLTSQDHLSDLVPDYWKPCLLAASTGRRRKHYEGCSFPPELAAIPGVTFSSDEPAENAAQKAGPIEPDPVEPGPGKLRPVGPARLGAPREEEKLPDGVFRVGRGVTAPKIISQSEPEFSELARRAQYQGVILLSLIVDKTGQTRNIRIMRPVGMGLDQKAVECVTKWQFRPGAKDGELVDVEMSVETNFHLY